MWNNLPLSKFCNSLNLEIPPPPIILSGHLQLNQTHTFQILQPYEFNQTLQEFELDKYGTNQKHYLHSVWPNPTCPISLHPVP